MLEAAGTLIEQDDIDMVTNAMLNMNGPKKYYYVEQFEKEFAKYHGRKYALMTPNCSTAINLLLTGLRVNQNCNVMAPDMTWIGSVAGASWLKAPLIFCDVEEKSWCIDPQKIEDEIKFNNRSGRLGIRAIIAVNLYGNMCAWSDLKYISDKYEIYLIEDGAESLGSLYSGQKSGTFGVGSVFSFHRTKTMTTGEGGMLLIDSDELFERCRMLRDHGRGPETKPYVNDILGYKYMPTNILAALGLSQFRKLDKLLALKRKHFEFYKQELSEFEDLQFNYEPSNVVNSAWITGMVLGKSWGLNKKQLLAKLEERNVPARPFFYQLSTQPAYFYDCLSNAMNARTDNKIAKDVSSRGINLPGSLTMTDEDLKFVVENVKEVLNDR